MQISKKFEVEKLLLANGCTLFLQNYLIRYYSSIEDGSVKLIIAPIDAALNRLTNYTNKTLNEIVDSPIKFNVLYNHLSQELPNINFPVAYDNIDGEPISLALFNKLKILGTFQLATDLMVLIVDNVIYLNNQLNDLKSYLPAPSLPLEIKTTIIRGPYALEKLVSKAGDRTVYVFYDLHTPIPTCSIPSIGIVEFIDRILKQPRNYVLDLVLETSLNNFVRADDLDHLNDLRFLLRDCYSNKSKCNYVNTRVHWTDVRFSGSNAILKDYMTVLISIEQANNMTSNYFKEHAINPVDLNKRLLNTLRVIDSGFSIDSILRSSKISKQIANIIDVDIRNRFLIDITNKIRFAHEKFQQLLNRPNQNYIDNKLYTSLLTFTAIFMDAYTIGRMLRNFGTTSLSNIIVYAGGAHSFNISQMLQNLDYRVINSVGVENHAKVMTNRVIETVQCLDITRLLPLFD